MKFIRASKHFVLSFAFLMATSSVALALSSNSFESSLNANEGSLSTQAFYYGAIELLSEKNNPPHYTCIGEELSLGFWKFQTNTRNVYHLNSLTFQEGVIATSSNYLLYINGVQVFPLEGRKAAGGIVTFDDLMLPIAGSLEVELRGIAPNPYPEEEHVDPITNEVTNFPPPYYLDEMGVFLKGATIVDAEENSLAYKNKAYGKYGSRYLLTPAYCPVEPGEENGTVGGYEGYEPGTSLDTSTTAEKGPVDPDYRD